MQSWLIYLVVLLKNRWGIILKKKVLLEINFNFEEEPCPLAWLHLLLQLNPLTAKFSFIFFPALFLAPLNLQSWSPESITLFNYLNFGINFVLNRHFHRIFAANLTFYHSQGTQIIGVYRIILNLFQSPKNISLQIVMIFILVFFN